MDKNVMKQRNKWLALFILALEAIQLSSCRERSRSLPPNQATFSEAKSSNELNGVVCIAADSSPEGDFICVPADHYVAHQHETYRGSNSTSNLLLSDEQTTSVQNSNAYTKGILTDKALVSPQENYLFESAEIFKCSRLIHVFIGVKVTWRNSSQPLPIFKRYVTGAVKSDDAQLFIANQVDCSPIKTYRTQIEFERYVRAVPLLNNAANPFGDNFFTGLCAPLTGAPCHNAIYEHCRYLKKSGDLSNSVGVGPLMLKCIDSIFDP